MTAAVNSADERPQIAATTVLGLLGVVFGPLLAFGGHFTSDVLAFGIGLAWMSWFGWSVRGYMAPDINTDERGIH
jgi:hypothetical protein